VKTNIIFSYLAQLFLELKMFQAVVVEKIETHTLSSKTFFSKNRTIYEIMCKNVVERDKPQTTKLRMRIACRIPKAKNTQYAVLHKNSGI
jgi:hypothetical protein